VTARGDLLPRFPRGRGPTAVVAGAGIAGLVAARELEAAGLRVVVLEASDRVGGRVRTLRGFPGGAHAEGGADLFEDGHDDLFDLARELGLSRARVLRGGFGWRGAGGREGEGAWTSLRRAIRPLGEAVEASGAHRRSALEAQ
jgi:monoamine oxidase